MPKLRGPKNNYIDSNAKIKGFTVSHHVMIKSTLYRVCRSRLWGRCSNSYEFGSILV